MTSTRTLRIPTKLLQDTMKILRKNYGCTMANYRSADYRSLQVTTGHYGHYGHYRFRGKIPWFADEQTSEVIVIEIKPGNPLTSKK